MDLGFRSMKPVYYLVHQDTDRRLRYYTTLAGARIAQRSRNHRLGFVRRVERVWIGPRELEQCLNCHGELLTATWAIEEDYLEQEDLCLPYTS